MYEKLGKYIGQEITYKQICEITEVKYTGGKAKTLQIEDISRYYSLNKNKTKYLIIEKYETPLAKEDNRTNGNNIKYADDIENVLLYRLQTQEKDEYECTINQALLLCKMINENYTIGRKDIPLTSKVLELDEKNVYMFYDNASKKLKGTFERTLDRMRNKALISYTKLTKVAYKDVTICENKYGEPVVDERNKINYIVDDIHRYATKEEMLIILECEANTLNELGYQSKQDVFLAHMWNVYRNLLSKKLLEKANIKYYYDVYNILINKDQVVRAIQRIESSNSKNTLNQNIVESLNKSLDNKVLCEEITDELNKYYQDTKKMIDTTINSKIDNKLNDMIIDYKKHKKKDENVEVINDDTQNDIDDNIPF